MDPLDSELDEPFSLDESSDEPCDDESLEKTLLLAPLEEASLSWETLLESEPTAEFQPEEEFLTLQALMQNKANAGSNNFLILTIPIWSLLLNALSI